MTTGTTLVELKQRLRSFEHLASNGRPIVLEALATLESMEREIERLRAEIALIKQANTQFLDRLASGEGR